MIVTANYTSPEALCLALLLEAVTISLYRTLLIEYCIKHLIVHLICYISHCRSLWTLN